MENFINILNDIFDTKPKDSKEILYEFSCNYKDVSKDKLLYKNEMLKKLESSGCDDEINITFHFSDGSAYISNKINNSVDYDDYLKSNQSDIVNIDVKIIKKYEQNCLNIYELKSFAKFLSDCKFKDHFANFTKLFSSGNNFILFKILDDSLFDFKTKTIYFTNKDKFGVDIKRDELLCKCNDSSLFLDRTKIKIIPDDFNEIESLNKDCVEVVDVFKKLCRILSYIYVANSSFIQGDKVILSFNPSDKGEEYEFEELAKNETILKIYEWVYKDDNSVDKANIARNIINIHCHSKNDILKIGDKIFNSIKSNYQIYQKNHVNQYIELKNKISDHIIETTKQIQELSHELSNSLRDNFVAFVAFLMASFLTNSIDLSMSINETISNFDLICIAFVFLTAVYFVATFLIFNEKWKWIENSYNNLKSNYEGVLDKKDLEENFNKNDSFNKTKNSYCKFKIKSPYLHMKGKNYNYLLVI